MHFFHGTSIEVVVTGSGGDVVRVDELHQIFLEGASRVVDAVPLRGGTLRPRLGVSDTVVVRSRAVIAGTGRTAGAERTIVQRLLAASATSAVDPVDVGGRCGAL